jgi:hypothetical protein
MCPRMDALVAAAVLALGFAAPAAHGAFGVQSFSADVWKDAAHSQAETQAGAHPFVGVTSFTFDNSGVIPDDVRNIRVDLPPGLISNPQATDHHCTTAQFDASNCPADTQIGTEELTAVVVVGLVATTYVTPIYNMEPGPDQVSDFAFSVPVLAPRTDIIGGVRDTTDSGLFFKISDVAELAPAGEIRSSKLTFWGVPSAAAHDAQRGQICTINLGLPVCLGGGTTVPRTNKPFLSLPTACDGPQTTTLTVTSWGGQSDSATSVTKVNGQPQGATGCEDVPFNPSISVTPGTTQADAPTSADVTLHVPQSSTAATLASAHLKDAVVTLPDGMTINPGAANGLQSCTDAQFAKGTHDPIACPPASSIGTVSIETPVLPDPLTGTIFLGEPKPGDMFRLFLEAHGFGLTIRLAGSVTPDPQTGRLTATFAGTPQVPFTDFKLQFAGGPTATLATPLACGPATTTSALTPYSGAPAATPSDVFTVDADGAGGACPPTPFTLGFAAGTADQHAGAFSPFTLTVTREDRQNFLSRLSVREPPGLLGMLSNVPLCGADHAAAGTCPEATRVGTSSVKSGAGSQPFALSGPVYLTGPYGGAPFGLSIAIRALAGPFDLGTVVVRAAIHVDPSDSHLTIDADPLPQILEGIPLRLREVTVAIDRAGFIFNPTSCVPLAIGATLTAVDGTVQEVSAPFQATGCDALPFSPKLSATANGKTSEKNGAGLKVTLQQPAGQSNVRSVSVQLPKRLTARGTTVTGACLEATFRADPSACAGAQIGTVAAVTPVLTTPLGGPVYLVAHGTGLPTIEALMRGQGLTVDLSGTIKFTTIGLNSTFETVPDVPITSFVLDLPTGPHSALSASKGVCGGALTMPTTIVGQNGARVEKATPIVVTGCGLKILSSRVKGAVATLVVQVPRAGTLTARGKGLRKASRKVTKGGNVTLKLRLSKSGRALRARRHRAHRKLKVPVTLRLGSLKASRTLAFK